MRLRSEMAASLQILAIAICFVGVWSSGAAGCGSHVETTGQGTGATSSASSEATSTGTGATGTGGTSTASQGASTSSGNSSGMTTGGCPPGVGGNGVGGNGGGGGSEPCPDDPPTPESPCTTEGQCCDYLVDYCDHMGGETFETLVYTCTDGTWDGRYY